MVQYGADLRAIKKTLGRSHDQVKSEHAMSLQYHENCGSGGNNGW